MFGIFKILVEGFCCPDRALRIILGTTAFRKIMEVNRTIWCWLPGKIEFVLGTAGVAGICVLY